MNEEIQKTALRLPKSLHEAIHAAAKESGRTMNAEIVYRLQQSFILNNQPEPTTLKRKEKTSNLLDRSELNYEEQAKFNEIMHQMMDLMSKARDRGNRELK